MELMIVHMYNSKKRFSTLTIMFVTRIAAVDRLR